VIQRWDPTLTKGVEMQFQRNDLVVHCEISREEDCLHQFATPPLPSNPLKQVLILYPLITFSGALHGPTRLPGDAAVADHAVRYQKLLQSGKIMGENGWEEAGTDASTMSGEECSS